VITNERQYKITKSQLAKLKAAIDEFSMENATKRVGSEILATAELQALESEVGILEEQLLEYEQLQSGAIATFETSSLAELPGMLIRARIAQRLSQKDLANMLGYKEQQIQRYESEEYSGVSLQKLMKIADALKLTIRETAKITPFRTSLEPAFSMDLDWRKFPIKEIYRRGWFEGFAGSLESAKRNADTLVPELLINAANIPLSVFHRRSVRSNSQSDELALFAWECRVLILANRVKPHAKYSSQLLDPLWFSELRKVSSKENGPIEARAMLQELGIPLIIEPHLEYTYLDGAALLSGEFPVIGMTLRFDRLDNFWFVLLHELFHVIRHLQKDKLETVFDDLENESQDTIEKEADILAAEALIPNEWWENALPRYVRSTESILKFASDHGISPSIVAGRIRKEAENYKILNDLIGQGTVRKQFPDVFF
jgi:HTH-type transcriptional regulator/antitoxin HigA